MKNGLIDFCQTKGGTENEMTGEQADVRF